MTIYTYVVYQIGLVHDIISGLKSNGYELVELEYSVHTNFNSGLFILRKHSLSMGFIKPKVDKYALRLISSKIEVSSEVRLEDFFYLVYRQTNQIHGTEDYNVTFSLVFNLEMKFSKNLSSFIIHNYEAILADGITLNKIDEISII